MGTFANTNAVESGTVPAGAVGETPVRWSAWSAQTGGDALTDGTLLDDTTGVAPAYQVALGDRFRFQAGDFNFTVTPAANQEEALYTAVLSGTAEMWIQLHTGAVGADRDQNLMTGMARFRIDAWTYDPS